MPYVVLLVIPIALVIAAWLAWRLLPGRGALPCPTSLAWLLDNPFTAGYHNSVVSRLELSPGLHVLDAGCGPGLLTTKIAPAVLPKGRVLALDIQPGMITRARARVAQAELSNLNFMVAPLGGGQLPTSFFDRALIVTVLGEIPDKEAALAEVFSSLKAGGFVSITEVLPDPHYQSMSTITSLARQVGFRVRNKVGNFLMFTVNLEKPLGA